MILGVMNVFSGMWGNWLGLHCNLVLVHSHCLRTEFITSMGENLLLYNPMTRVMQSYQSIFAYHQAPNWYSLWPVLALAIIFCVIGFRMFRKHAADMVDEL